MFTGISGTTGINGTSGTTGIIGVVVNGGLEMVLKEVDDEQGEVGVEQNKTLTGVEKQLG